MSKPEQGAPQRPAFPQLPGQTDMVHGGTTRSQWGETSEALFLNSGFVYESAEQAEARFKGDADGFVYSRYANPTTAMFEERIRLLEGAEAARATGSGMAAVAAALFALLEAGDHVVAARALFGSCRYIIDTLLPRFGVEFTLIDGRDVSAWQAAARPNTKVFFFETPANPLLEIIDIRAVSEIAYECGATVVVDNVFATPLLQRPLALGAHVVTYSATKHIDGQGRCLGGAVLGSRDFIEKKLHDYLKHTGPSLSPFNAWVLLKGLETLHVRVERQCQSARLIADAFAAHPGIEQVFYPGRSDHPEYEVAAQQMAAGGTMVAMNIRGDKPAAFRFLNALKIVKISNNLGDAKSLITHPATTTHQRLSNEDRAQLKILAGSLRLSVGLENAQELIDDLNHALALV